MATLHTMREYFNTGATLSYSFRKESLLTLKVALIKYEDEINEALYNDLKKSKEESYATETGLIMSEINYALKNLKKWMRPKKVSSGLLTFPSSSKIHYDSLGVVLIIAPWNYPLYLMLSPLIGAIAGGNCVVLKPSEAAPATEKMIQKFTGDLFDKNYISVVTGDGSTVVPLMINDLHFDHIFYTGSTAVGKEIYKMAAAQLIPVTLELGGKSPCIVAPGANVKVAAKRIVLGKFLNAGQTCIAPDYILVHASLKEELLAALVTTIKNFYTNDPSTSYDYGKIINEKRFQKLISFIKNGNVFYGGQYDEGTLYIQPTLLTGVSMEDAVMNEEIFGPILPILTYSSLGEAVQIISQNKNPLACYLFTNDKKVEKEFIRNIPFGGGCINNTLYHISNKQLPFGGIGNSGIGAYHGRYTFDVFTHAKPILKTGTWLDPAIKYPGMKGKYNLLKKIIG